MREYENHKAQQEVGTNEVGIAKGIGFIRPDEAMTIERVPGGFIVTTDYGQRAVCANLRAVIEAVERKYSREGQTP